MTLDELQQIKDSLDKGVMIHRKRWLEVLDWAIELTKHHEVNGGLFAPITYEQAHLIAQQMISGAGIPSNDAPIRFINGEIK